MLTRTFIKECVNEYVVVYLKNDSNKNPSFHEGILKDFKDDVLILENQIGIKYSEIKRFLPIAVQ